MDKKELATLIKGALLKSTVPGVNFADSNEAVRKGLMEFYGVTEDMTYREIARATNNNFAIIEDVIDETLPQALENIMGSWATILSFGRDEEVVYKIKGLGKRRAMLGIAPGARSGVYKSYRLDGKNLSINTRTYTAGTSVSLEDILLGRLTLGEMMDQILMGLEYQVYKDIVSALRTIKTKAPAANVASGAGFNVASVDKLIRVVSAYGTPVMICFRSFASKISNAIGATTSFNPNVPTSDVDSWKSQGYVSVYKGINAIVLPNFIVDELTNDKWAFSEADCWILPVGEKPVIVAMRGDSVIVNHELPAGGAEQQLSKMMGTAILTYNNLAIYTDTEITSAEGEI